MITKALPLLYQKQDEIARSVMQNPTQLDPILVAGQWQGLDMAIEILKALYADKDEDS